MAKQTKKTKKVAKPKGKPLPVAVRKVVPTRKTSTKEVVKKVVVKVYINLKKKSVKKQAPKKKVVQKKTKAVAKKKVLPSRKKIEKKIVREKSPAQKKVLKPVTTDKVPQKFSSYSLDQYKLYLSLKNVWENKTNAQIKEALKKNGQTMSGNKDEIVNRVLDGIVLGNIPRCPHCYGGRPKYNQQNGSYFCVGYRDDEDFKWCNKTISFADLPRTPWQE